MKVTTGEFARRFNNVDFEATPIRVWDEVEFNPEQFSQLTKESYPWYILESSDGPVSHVFEDPRADTKDHSHTNKYFGLHTDGQYLDEVPPQCLLYSVDAGSGNTPTVFADSRHLVQELYRTGAIEDAMQFDFVYTKKEGARFRRPLIEINPLTGEEVMCVVGRSGPIRLVPSHESLKTEKEGDSFLDELSQLAASSLELVVHHWRTQQMVAFDNLSLVHGRGLSEREEVSPDTRRHLIRMWVGREALRLP